MIDHSDPGYTNVRLGELSTPSLSDALDHLGINGQIAGIKPMDGSFRVGGPAYTLHYQPTDVDGGTVGDFVDDVPAGAVIVIDNGGRTDATVWGDILTLVADRRGIGGTVIDGICRDRGRCRALAYPVFARDHWMRTGKDRVQLVGEQVPVSVGGVRVRPGDIVVGDEDGVVAIPATRSGEVLAVALRIEAAEEKIRDSVLSGERLAKARAEYGYHALQTNA